MKKISNAERFLLEMVDNDKYNTYRCPQDGIYQIRKDLPESKQVCVYCKQKYPSLSEGEINQLLK